MKTQNQCDTILHNNSSSIRAGCKDIWNAFMVEGAVFGKHDIPFCPTTATFLPKDMITWEEAKQIHKKQISKKNYDYFENVFVNWYIDDYKFDGPRGIWNSYNFVLRVLRHFAGAITPDFSTYQDFPEPLKEFATYRMRAYGYWLGNQGIAVINNVRWGTEETFDYCFEGIPYNSIVSIGTVGGGPRKHVDKDRFEAGLIKMVETLKPHTILVYGSSEANCFENLKKQGINIVSYKSQTARIFERRKQYE